MSESDQTPGPPPLPESLSQILCLGVTSATHEQRNNDGIGSLPPLSLSYLSPPFPDRPHLHHAEFHRLFQIRAILRSETDPIRLEDQSFTEEEPQSRSRSVKLTAGGLDETSYVTRLIPVTSFVMREDIFRRTSGGKTYLPKRERFRVKL